MDINPNVFNNLENLANLAKGISNISTNFNNLPHIYHKLPDFDDYEIVDSPVSKLPDQLNSILEANKQQIDLLSSQNNQLIDNYNKLDALYKVKEIELESAKKDAEQSKLYNKQMMKVTVVAMIAAVISAIIAIYQTLN